MQPRKRKECCPEKQKVGKRREASNGRCKWCQRYSSPVFSTINPSTHSRRFCSLSYQCVPRVAGYSEQRHEQGKRCRRCSPVKLVRCSLDDAVENVMALDVLCTQCHFTRQQPQKRLALADDEMKKNRSGKEKTHVNGKKDAKECWKEKSGNMAKSWGCM